MVLSSCRISDVWKLFKTIEVRNNILCAKFICTKKPSPEVMLIIFRPVSDMMVDGFTPYRISEQKMREGFRRLLTLAGVDGKHITPHDLRRSFVTNFLSLGIFPDHLLAVVFTGHKMTGERTIFHGYNQANIAASQKTLLSLLKMVQTEDLAGVELV